MIKIVFPGKMVEQRLTVSTGEKTLYKILGFIPSRNIGKPLEIHDRRKEKK